MENYLLNSHYIRAAATALTARDIFASDDDVRQGLKVAAESLVPRLVVERLQKIVNDRMVNAMNIGAPPDSLDAPAALLPSIVGTLARLDEARSEIADIDSLRAAATEIEERLREWLGSDQWLVEFPGSIDTSTICSQQARWAANYEAFRNLIVDQMVDDGYQPLGMRTVIDHVLAVHPQSTEVAAS